MALGNFLIGEFGWRRVMWSLILIPLLVYLALGLIAYLFADKLIFQPQPAFYNDKDSFLMLAAPNGEKVSAKFFADPNAEYTILFSHGNAEDIFGATPFFERLRDAGFNVFVYDYRGYGASAGAPSERNAYEDAAAAYEYLTNELKIAPAKIIVHGRSLGAAVSIDLAARKKCAGLIVESGFVSAFRVLTHYPVFPFDKFQNLKKIKDVKAPVLFIHGRNDEVIPFWHGETLLAAANEPKSSLWLDEAGHNNVFLRYKELYLQAIRDFARDLPK
jgi:fermentation-respiration switch protein FrsA (DUF1100 family)